MTTPKTIRVKRVAEYTGDCHRFDNEDHSVSVYLSEADVANRPDVLDITITPLSIKQQRREAREEAVRNRVGAYVGETVDAIEQADAEFDQAREAEARSQWEKLLRGFVGNIREMSEARYNPDGLIRETVDAIEAIYRGER